MFDFVASNLHLVERPSMRMYLKAWERKDAGLDWKSYLHSVWVRGATGVVARLMHDESHRTEEERVAAFVDETGLCRATYYNHKKKLAKPGELVPAIKLANSEPRCPRTGPLDLEMLLRSRHGKLGNG